MTKYKIEIEIETSAPVKVMGALSHLMEVQAEWLNDNDGVLLQHKPYEYKVKKVSVLKEVA